MDKSSELTFTDYVRPVWRFKLIVIALVIIAAAGTYVIANRGAKSYTTSTKVFVGQTSIQQALSGGTGLSPRQVTDEAGLITTPAVARLVGVRLKTSAAPATLLGLISATPSADSDFVTITAVGGDPAFIAQVADGFAAAYLELSRRNSIAQARAALRGAEAQLRRARNVTSRQALTQEVTQIEGLVVSPPGSGQQLAAAYVPTVPTSPKPTRDAIFAAVLALVLGIIVSYLLDRSDRRVRRLGDLEDLFDLPVLASIPRMRRRDRGRGQSTDVPSSVREPYRALRVNLDLARRVNDAKVVMVSSALPGEGKSTIVANLALTYRNAGTHVVILETDLRRPTLAERLGLTPDPGLTEWLRHGGEVHVQTVASGGGDSNANPGAVDVIVGGRASDDPTALLTADRLRDLIASLASRYDVVLIDSPPLLSVSDALPLLSLADGVMLVVRSGKITPAAAQRLRETIARVGDGQNVEVLGVAANEVDDDLVTPDSDTPASRNGAGAPTATAGSRTTA